MQCSVLFHRILFFKQMMLKFRRYANENIPSSWTCSLKPDTFEYALVLAPINTIVEVTADRHFARIWNHHPDVGLMFTNKRIICLDKIIKINYINSNNTQKCSKEKRTLVFQDTVVHIIRTSKKNCFTTRFYIYLRYVFGFKILKVVNYLVLGTKMCS